MHVILKPGERVTIGFHKCDGEITVAFNDKSLTMKADLEDNYGRKGVIYRENFGNFFTDNDIIEATVGILAEGKF